MNTLPLVTRVPICEVRGSVVLNVDGSLAYGFALEPLAFNASSSAGLEETVDKLAALLRSLPDNVILQMLFLVSDERPLAVERFAHDLQARAEREKSEARAHLAADIAKGITDVGFRSTRAFLFVCVPYAFQNAMLVRAGAMPVLRPRMSKDAYERATKMLLDTASVVGEALSESGIACKPAEEHELLELAYRHLNPQKAVVPPRHGESVDAGRDVPDSWPRELDPSLTLREQLCSTHFEAPNAKLLVAGDIGIRVLSLKDLPDSTWAGMLAGIFFRLPMNSLLSFSIEKLPAESTLAGLKMRRSMAHGVSAFSSRRNIDAEVQHVELERIMTDLSQSAMALVAMQISCALYAPTPDELFEKTTAVEQLFASAGVRLLVEDYNHLDAYMALLPGAVHRFRRAKTVTDINAAQLFVPLGSSPGSSTGPMLLRTRSGDPFRFDPFDARLNAYNGLIVGATGSGKSFFTNLMLAQHMAEGGHAIVVDVGGSYRRLTRLFDGQYVDIGASHSVGLNPLPSPHHLNGKSAEDREAMLTFCAGFLELLLSETGAALPTSERALIAKALNLFYDPHGPRAQDPATPNLRTLQHFFSDCKALDQDAAARLVARFDLWTEGPRARLFERSIDLDLSPAITSIDLKPVENDRDLQAVALYVLSYVIWNKLGARTHKTIVVFDECWALLSAPPAAKLLESLVRTSRKYGAGLWCLSQSVDDFVKASIGDALLTNCFTRVVLQQEPGQQARPAEVFKLSDHALAAFATIRKQDGHYSEAFIQTPGAAELVQIAPSPLAYWMATTKAQDVQLESATVAANPRASQLRVLRSLAEQFPRGVQ